MKHPERTHTPPTTPEGIALLDALNAAYDAPQTPADEEYQPLHPHPDKIGVVLYDATVDVVWYKDTLVCRAQAIPKAPDTVGYGTAPDNALGDLERTLRPYNPLGVLLRRGSIVVPRVTSDD